MTSWDGKETVRLTTARSPSRPRAGAPTAASWPSSRARDDENDVSQLWLLPRAGGEAEKITELRGGVEDFDWAPDGRRPRARRATTRIRTPPTRTRTRTRTTARRRTKKPIVIDRYQFKLDEYGYLGRSAATTSRSSTARPARPRCSPRATTTRSCRPGRPTARPSRSSPSAGADPDRTDNWDLYAIEPRPGADAAPADDLRGRRQRAGLGQPASPGAPTAARSPTSRAARTSSSTTACTGSRSCPRPAARRGS